MGLLNNRFGIFLIVSTLLLRVVLSTLSYNNDVNNHIAWVESAKQHSWQGIYERDMGSYAPVNYPPLTLYAFTLSERLFEFVPAQLATDNLRAAFYKLPSLLADSLIAWLIWRYLRVKRKWKIATMLIFLFNPALIYNSVWWGQIESLGAAFAIWGVMLLPGNISLALLLYLVSLLFKQNSLPLLPIFLYVALRSPLELKKYIGVLLVSTSLIYFAYAPLAPHGQSPLVYGISSYLSFVSGQSHQHQASVNAFNLWYMLGYNLTQDDTVLISSLTIRQVSVFLTVVGVAVALLYLHRGKLNYRRIWTSIAILSFFVFLFAARMHERHSYMLIAYLTMLLPYIRRYLPYIVLSGISFYNLYAVWSETLYYNYNELWWIYLSRGLSLISLISLVTIPWWIRRKSTT